MAFPFNGRRHLKKIAYTKEQVAEYRKKYRAYRDALRSGWENKPYNEFLDLVVDRPADLPHASVACPFCEGETTSHGLTRTLVGNNDRFDTNHHWNSRSCKACRRSFTVEYKGEYDQTGYNVWYTFKDSKGRSKILKGIPTCFESYVYTCRHCNGNVVNLTIEKATGNPTTCTSYNLETGESSTFDRFLCEGCGRSVEPSNDYYLDHTPHRPRRPTRPLRVNWVIYEEIGTAIISDYALKKIENEWFNDEK